jgi:hypothetical protein
MPLHNDMTSSSLEQDVIIMASACHRYRYTRGFHTGLAAGTGMGTGTGTGTGTRMPTRQKPVPAPVPVMVIHVAQPNAVSHATHLSFSLSPPPHVHVC